MLPAAQPAKADHGSDSNCVTAAFCRYGGEFTRFCQGGNAAGADLGRSVGAPARGLVAGWAPKKHRAAPLGQARDLPLRNSLRKSPTHTFSASGGHEQSFGCCCRTWGRRGPQAPAVRPPAWAGISPSPEGPNCHTCRTSVLMQPRHGFLQFITRRWTLEMQLF